MNEEYKRIKELDDVIDFNREWFFETDSPVGVDTEETVRISGEEIINKFKADEDKFGSVKIGKESTIRNPVNVSDNENIMSGSILRNLFTKTYNFNNNDIVDDNTNSLNIISWDTAAIGNMVWHNGHFKCTLSNFFPKFTFKNVSPNPSIGDKHLTNCVYKFGSAYQNISAFMSGVSDGNDGSLTELSLYYLLEAPIELDFYINGWYFRNR